MALATKMRGSSHDPREASLITNAYLLLLLILVFLLILLIWNP